MAGQPRKQAMIVELDRRTRLHFEDDEHTTLEYVVAWIESGETLVKLAAEISEDAPIHNPDLSSAQITQYLRKQFGQDIVDTRFVLARRIGAHALIERSIETADDVKNKDDVPVAKLRNDTRFWVAERWNRDEMGGQKGVQVQVNIGRLHIDAMRARALQPAEVAQVLAIEDAESTESESDA